MKNDEMSRRKRRIVWRIFLTGAAFLFALTHTGCAPQHPGAHPSEAQTDAPYLIGISLPTTRLVYRNAMKELVLEAYSDPSSGARAEILLYDADGSQKQQNQDIMELVDLGVDGIVLVPNTMEGGLSAVEYANQNGVPVITVDNQIYESASAKAISFVGADHYAMGKDAAELFLETLEEKFPDQERWNVIHLTGIPDSSGAIDRGRAITDVLSQEARIHLLGSFDGEFTVENAESVMEDCLEIFDEIDGIICQNDNMAEGCYRALAKAHKDGSIVVVGIDGQNSTLEIMSKGGIHGTVLQYPTMILKGIELLCDALDGAQLDSVYYEPTDRITPDNVEYYLQNGLSW